MDKFFRPEFTKSLFGLNVSQVNEYISRLESEIDITYHQQAKSMKEIKEAGEELDRMKNQVNTAWTEAETMRSENSIMQAKIHELEMLLQEQMDENARLRREKDELQQALQKSDNPEMIKEAILSAQRMGQIIVQEANQQADSLRDQAKEEYADAQTRMQQFIQDKNEEAEGLINDAQMKCEDLKQKYDSILTDVSDFKAEMIALYNRHLELLYTLPDHKTDCEEIQPESEPASQPEEKAVEDTAEDIAAPEMDDAIFIA